MFAVLERLCSASGHRCGPLCTWIVRRDAWWRISRPAASARHRELRARYEGGVSDLPFPPVAETVAVPDSVVESRERFPRSA
jgi:hypothetical protein